VLFAFVLIYLLKQREATEALTLLEQKMNDAMEKEAETWRLQEELERMKLEVDLKRQTLEAYEAEKRHQYRDEVNLSVDNANSSYFRTMNATSIFGNYKEKIQVHLAQQFIQQLAVS
jgi:hypothetical protein